MNQHIIEGQFIIFCSTTMYYYCQSNVDLQFFLPFCYMGLLYGILLFSMGAHSLMEQRMLIEKKSKPIIDGNYFLRSTI